jgi:hypothetical protein
MSTRPHNVLVYYCDHAACRALLVVLPEGALVYDTRLRCIACGHVTKLYKHTAPRMIDSAHTTDYTETSLAPR